MKKMITLVFFLLAVKGYSQYNLYTLNNGSFIEVNEIKRHLNSAKTTLPSAFEMTAVIYHKVVKNDTVINYINLLVSKKSSVKGSQELGFTYKQDSTFLLLNQRLPSFKLKDMNGKEIHAKKLLGKPTLINFWATYCGPCIAEMPQLSKLKQRYKDRMNFIAITENNVANDHLFDFLKNKDFNFQILVDGKTYVKKLKVSALPKNLFIDRYGILRYIQEGYPINIKGNGTAVNDNYFTEIIEKLIKNPN